MDKNTNFNFEDLEVWQKAINFSDKVIDIIDNLNTKRKHYRLIENLESSVVSIASNIAEGNGRYSKKGFIHFLYIARGSLYETITGLVIFNRRGWVTDTQLKEMKIFGSEIGRMISGLVVSIKNSMN